MKRLLSISLTVLALVLLVVSCSPESKTLDDGLALISFSAESGGTRSLGKVDPTFEKGDFYWYYTAEKDDTTGLKTGAKSTETTVNEAEGTKGINNAVGPFSYGKWRFTLYGYATCTYDTVKSEWVKSNLAYKGTSTVTVEKSSDNRLAVVVEPQATADGKGYLQFPEKGKITLTGTEVEPAYTAMVEKIVIKSIGTTASTTYTYYDGTNDSSTSVAMVADSDTGTRTVTLPSGNYSITVSYQSSADESAIVYATDSIVLPIADYLTTKINGDIAENNGSVTINVSSGVVYSVSESKSLENLTEGESSVKITVNSSPATKEDDEGNTVRETTIEVPVAIAANASTAVVATKSYSVESASAEQATFEISGTGEASSDTAAVLGGLDIDLYLNGSDQKTTAFADNQVLTITTQYVKGLGDYPYSGAKSDAPCSHIVVKYNGGEEKSDGTVTKYNSGTGELTFTVDHLSSFYLGATNAVVYDSTTQTAYETLQDAFGKAASGDSLVLLKDIASVEKTIEISKSFSFDLNGNNITSDKRVFLIHAGTLTISNSKTTDNKGIISANISNDIGSSVIRLDASNGNAGLVLNKGVTINAPSSYGITAFGKSNNITITVYGKIESANPCLGGNGSKDYFGCSVTMNVCDGAELSQDSSSKGWNGATTNNDPVAVYQPNIGVLNIYGGTITSKNGSAVEIRAGKANISGGTLVSEAAYACPNPNGNGPTTAGAAVAVSQHTTEKAIDVVISGGTFTADAGKQLAVVNPQSNAVEYTKNVKVTVGSGVTMDANKIVGKKTGGSAGVDGVYYVNAESAREAGVGAEAKIGKDYYLTLQDAFEYIRSEKCTEKEITINILADKVALGKSISTLLNNNDTSGYTITFVGKGKDSCSIDITTGKSTEGEGIAKAGGNYVEGANLTFKDIKVIIGDEKTDYQGFARAGKLVFENCSFVGRGNSWSENTTFTNCDFSVSDDWISWLYIPGTYVFDNCTFTNTGGGEFLHVYNEAGGNWTITIKNCSFTGSDSKGKPAVVIKTSYVNECSVTFEGNNKYDGTIGEYSNAPAELDVEYRPFFALFESKSTVWKWGNGKSSVTVMFGDETVYSSTNN